MLRCKVFSKQESGDAQVRRRTEILDAAEHCFVQWGFHRTTIQKIAADAGMSVGNLYRYFASKDAIVEALVGRDQATMARDFDSFSNDDLMGAFALLMRRQIVERGRDQAVLWLEICAEAARNPTVANVTHAHKAVISANLTRFFSRVIAERRGSGLTTVAEPQALARLVTTLFAGHMMTQALSPAADSPEARVDEMLAIVSAAVKGEIALNAPAGIRMEAVA